MKKCLFIIFTLLVFISCEKNKQENKSRYLRHVGDIEHDSNIDDEDFIVCNESTATQYFAFGEHLPYEGEKYEIEKIFFEKYKTPENSTENGLVRIRFVVNCKGEAGRFRLMAMNDDYQEKKFDNKITGQLMALTKGLDGWRVMVSKSDPRDYYVYLIFKIRNGELVDIMP
ncbi:MAG: hypothetical protein AAFZ15_26510 [Bacteroidota bacterium]